MPQTLIRPHRPALDAACRAAVEQAHAALLEIAPADHIGEYLGPHADDERVVTHRFVATAPGYRGWEWAVTVARAPRARVVTVDEIVLLPGTGAVVAPQWVPWSDRVAPGDLRVGDRLPTAPDDDRLAPGWSPLDDLAAEADNAPLRPPGWELGIGRKRVLQIIGREEAAERWRGGETGPTAPMAKAAPACCATCGFLLAIGGPMGAAFGVCANVLAPADGRVVSLDFGCGAHSEISEIELA